MKLIHQYVNCVNAMNNSSIRKRHEMLYTYLNENKKNCNVLKDIYFFYQDLCRGTSEITSPRTFNCAQIMIIFPLVK